MSTCRHGPECPYRAEAVRTFDAWLEAVKRADRGEISTQQLREARAEYDRAREDMIRECVLS